MTVTTDVVSAITSHHAELQEALTTKVADVLTAARNGTPRTPAVAALNALLAHDIVPHARAEEDVLYAAATSKELRPLVLGMLYEHETLLGLATELNTASTDTDAAGIARAIREVFVGHVRRENEILLPALASDPTVDLVALMPVMEERFSSYQEPKTLPLAGPALSGPDRELDVREEPPARRHNLIFQTYAQTKESESFVLVNDHDPKPLFYQFEAEETGRFTWDYLESGPQVWKVRIGRKSS
ncbi:MAG TPA: DUF2249 domain-containing protein [Candidatus Nanopelagicaceae bacterium]|nr:DUF2249 domain-containing protein [Candidatus Nanopelagicaceae bacterium]